MCLPDILPSQSFAIREKQFKMKSGQCKCNCITFRQYNTMLNLGEKWKNLKVKEADYGTISCKHIVFI